MKNLKYFLISGLVFALDQLSKWAVVERILRPRIEGATVQVADFFPWLMEKPKLLGFTQIEIFPFFNLVMVWNKGISFGMLNGDFVYGPEILIALTIIICGIFALWLLKNDSALQGTGIALVIGGALGNIIDRLRFGAVADFLDFHVYHYHWPAFNVADSCVCIGVALMIAQAVLNERTANKSYEDADEVQ